MIKGNYNSLSFFRKYFQIPASQKLSWALITETVRGETEVRLGVVFTNHPNVYLDVAMRRFFWELEFFNGHIVRKVYPARRIAQKDTFLYVTEGGLSEEFPKSFIADIYFPSVYSSQLFIESLF